MQFCVLIGCYIFSEDITDLSPDVFNCGIIVHVSKALCITECILNKVLNVLLQLLDRTVKLTAVKIKVSRKKIERKTKYWPNAHSTKYQYWQNIVQPLM